jgi:hypothetical protein
MSVESINWRLVFRHVLPAIYIPLAAYVAFAILVALTGAGRYEFIEEVGLFVAGSTLVLVFVRLAARDRAAATANVLALVVVCECFAAMMGILGGAWGKGEFWLVLLGLALVLSGGAFVALRWARRLDRWRTTAGS